MPNPAYRIKLIGVAMTSNIPSDPPPCAPPSRAIETTAAIRMPGTPKSATCLQNTECPEPGHAKAAEAMQLRSAAIIKIFLLRSILLSLIPPRYTHPTPNCNPSKTQRVAVVPGSAALLKSRESRVRRQRRATTPLFHKRTRVPSTSQSQKGLPKWRQNPLAIPRRRVQTLPYESSAHQDSP
jgi:hypothetical protein